MALTKNDIIEMVSSGIGDSKSECSQWVEACFDIIKDELSKGNDVKISGFGKWTVKNKRPRKGRNPQNGDALVIPGRKVVTFKCSQKLKEATEY